MRYWKDEKRKTKILNTSAFPEILMQNAGQTD